ncbi:hypothetical protein [Aridibaculum aurantiacum]|uniref:hypothetical protein n=1 Tax=Aridibaculum aurantiacum TaxID=2810307 RepID=UPI001A963DF4|nr:hypothetical protein [Aridibaculum aurantiacum]
MKYRLIILLVLLVPMGVVAAMTVNYAVDCHLHPNICMYHFKAAPTNFIYQSFYSINASTGDHPEPTFFNLIFTALLGAMTAVVVAAKLNNYMENKKMAR